MEKEKMNLFSDDIIELRLERREPAMVMLGYPESYNYLVYLKNSNIKIGRAGIRIGNNKMTEYIGNFEYEIDPDFRKHGYASHILALLKQAAIVSKHKYVTVTCNLDNQASQKTILKAGGNFVGYVKIPPQHRLYKMGIKEIKSYQIDLEEKEGKKL